MKLELLGVVLITSLGVMGSGCSSMPKPWNSARKGILDHQRSIHSDDLDNESNSEVLTKERESQGEKTAESEASVSTDLQHAKSRQLGREAVKYFRSKKKRTRLYATEVKHESDGMDLQWPLDRVEISSRFGRRGRSFHEGIDLRANVGTSVRAAQAGKVIYASSRVRGYGKMIVIRHAGKVATIYAHNSTLLVKRGDVVRQGQEIALTGNSGHSTGPHLHFEVRRDVAAMNPLQVLPSSRPFDVSSLADPAARSLGRVPHGKKSARRSST